MKVAEFKSTLKSLADIYLDAGDARKASALEKLTEVFDDKSGEHEVNTFLKEIRRKRGLPLR